MAKANRPSFATYWRLILLLGGLAALGHLNRVGISVVGSEVFIPELGISETRMGWVYTLFLIGYTLFMLPGGWLIDRIGSRQALTLFALLMGLFVALTACSSLFKDAPLTLWVSLLIIRGLAGICSTPLHPGAAHAVADLGPGHNRADRQRHHCSRGDAGNRLQLPGVRLDDGPSRLAFDLCRRGIGDDGVWVGMENALPLCSAGTKL